MGAFPFFLVVISGAFMRFSYALRCLPIYGCERWEMLLAQKISLSPQSFFFPLENVINNHLILTNLFVLSGLKLLGENPFGLRFFFVVTGIASVVLIYKLLRGFSQRWAFFAAAILAFDHYHIGHSGMADNAVIVLFFSMLSIFVFWEGINGRKELLWWLSPLWILAYMAQEQMAVFVPAFFLFLFFTTRYRSLLRTKEILLAFLLFFGFVLSHLFQAWLRGTSLEFFITPGYIKFDLVPSLTGINFFLLRPISAILGRDYFMTMGWEAPYSTALTGLVLFVGLVYSLKDSRDYFVRFLLFLGGSQLLFFSFVRSEPLMWGEGYWARLSFIPAICLTARMLEQLEMRFRRFKYITGCILVVMFFEALAFSVKVPPALPPHRFATFVDFDVDFIERSMDKVPLNDFVREGMRRIGFMKDYDRAENECLKELPFFPHEVRLHNYLAESLYRKGDEKRAREVWLAALELEPFYPVTLDNIADVVAGDLGAMAKKLRGVLRYLGEKSLMEAARALGESRLLEIRPALFHFYKGCIAFSANDLSSAGEEFESSVALKNNFIKAHIRLAEVFLAKNELRDAERSLRKALEITPDDPLIYKYLAVICEMRKENHLAKQYQRMAANIIHDVVRADYDLANPDFSE